MRLTLTLLGLVGVLTFLSIAEHGTERIGKAVVAMAYWGIQ